MDSNRFDRLVMALSTADTRRGMVRFLGVLPFVGGLTMLLGEDETFADGRRRRHKKPHKHRKRTGNRAGRHKKQTGKKKHPDKGCKAEFPTETCVGTCGPVKNNCKKTIDCGPCDCSPPCGACESCNSELVCEACDLCCNDVCCPQAKAVCHAVTGDCCVPDSKSQTCNEQCGDVTNNCGLVIGCGSCTCGGGCPECHVCDEETDECVADHNQEGDDCGHGQICRADGICACSGGSCGACRTCGGDGICVGCPDCCAAGQCVASCPNCQTCRNGLCVSCPDCCDSNGDCQAGTTDAMCGSSGICVDCAATDRACVSQQCACTAGRCPTGCCQGGACHIDDDAACGANGGSCIDCGAGRRCLNGQCVCDGTSCPTGCCDAQGQCQVNTADVCGSSGAPCVTCNPCTQSCVDGTCQDMGGSCDCAALNACSGHGCCTPTCSCICDPPWTGADCSQLPQLTCADFETCEECSAHATDLGCVRCSDTFDGEFTACVAAIECFFAVESCQ